MNKFLIFILICSTKFLFGQVSVFSFRVNSVTESYDSKNEKYLRKYLDGEKTINVILSENELKSIKEYFDKVNFKTFPLRLKCDNSIDVLPSFDEIIQMTENDKTYLSINSNCIKINKNQETEFNSLWNFIFSILNDKSVIKNLKESNIELL